MGTLTVTAAELHAATDRFAREARWHAVRTPRFRMRYATWGDGPRPLVIVHGLCDRTESFAMLMANLVDHVRCISVELPNGKDDDANLGPYRHADFAHDLVALLDHLQLNEVDLLGSSFGSTVALRTAVTYPARLRRVVLQGGFARRPLIRAERGLARLGRYWPWRMGDLPIRESVMRRFEAHAFVTAPPEVFDFLIHNSGRTPVRAAAGRALLLDKLDLRPMLPRVRQPVLMIGGDRDTIVPRQYEAEVEAGVPDVRRVEFSPCGHYPQYTHPSRMAAEVRAFLTG
jgi:pimeloyl-ACP methyl ester carboxylesterase